MTLAVVRRGWGCFAAAAVATAQLLHHHAERLRRRACHARGPGPASTGIVDWSSPPRRTRNDLFAGAHPHGPRGRDRSNSCSVLLDSPGQTHAAWLTRGAASIERAPSAPCRSHWGGVEHAIVVAAGRAHPSGCYAPRRSDTITVGSQYPYRCPTRSPADRWSPRRPRDISGDSLWPGLLRSCRGGYRPGATPSR